MCASQQAFLHVNNHQEAAFTVGGATSCGNLYLTPIYDPDLRFPPWSGGGMSESLRDYMLLQQPTVFPQKWRRILMLPVQLI